VRTAIVIPARLGATRLPRKPLLALGDLPVIIRVLRQARKVPGIDAIVVATDAAEIAQAVKDYGGDAMMTRGDHQSGTDRVAEVADALGFDAIVNVQGDEPFVDPRDLAAIAQVLQSGQTDMATLVRPIDNRDDFMNPNVVKAVVRDDGQALYFSRAEIPYDRDGGHAFAGALRHIGVYGYTRRALVKLTRAPVHPMEQRERLEQLRALAIGMSIQTIRAESRGHGIDTEDDLAYARAEVARLGEAAFPGVEL
jgi:3-deoxy-manno-octulosonate cytidylyltransferase (CMP-KDO synthetase)